MKKEELLRILLNLVEVTGFEPATSASRTQRSTKLSHTSISYFNCTLNKKISQWPFETGSAQIIYSNKMKNSECRFKAKIEKLGKSKFIECMNKNFENRFVVFTFIFLTPCFYLIVFIFTSFTLYISYLYHKFSL